MVEILFFKWYRWSRPVAHLRRRSAELRLWILPGSIFLTSEKKDLVLHNYPLVSSRIECKMLTLDCETFSLRGFILVEGSYAVHNVRGSDCTWVRLYVGQTVRGSDCTWVRLYVGQTVRGSDCTWVRLYVGQTVRGSDCTWVRLYAGQTVRGSDCTWVRLYMGQIVHGSDCTRVRLYVGQTVRGSDCTWVILYVGQTVRGSDCTWVRLYVGQIVRGSHFTRVKLFAGQGLYFYSNLLVLLYLLRQQEHPTCELTCPITSQHYFLWSFFPFHRHWFLSPVSHVLSPIADFLSDHQWKIFPFQFFF